MSMGYYGLTAEFDGGNLRKNGVEIERKISGTIGYGGLSMENSLELIRNKFSAEFKSGFNGGIVIVGEGNVILKMVPVKK
ncbi:hypothetical protein LZQ00_10005 [Sphingobacterium sp. SRCM116780]|uniref:hypothetical protein n=1 Tax=Sphingobacterium sp. SRCM116780 TaxID=2907623 RepID=UPI001F1678CD|nr:hypothetical protein [Sphingobacterium sp. SRCM116780]UIR54607.1 hypothetical protein LZQ00_10005 [Sphingobacterium sp. SRCM116780]